MKNILRSSLAAGALLAGAIGCEHSDKKVDVVESQTRNMVKDTVKKGNESDEKTNEPIMSNRMAEERAKMRQEDTKRLAERREANSPRLHFDFHKNESSVTGGPNYKVSPKSLETELGLDSKKWKEGLAQILETDESVSIHYSYGGSIAHIVFYPNNDKKTVPSEKQEEELRALLEKVLYDQSVSVNGVQHGEGMTTITFDISIGRIPEFKVKSRDESTESSK